MLSQRKQLYLAIVVLLIIGVFFIPSVYQETKATHEFCCSSFQGKIMDIKLDSNDQWLMKLTPDQEIAMNNFLSNEDIEQMDIGDSIVKLSGNLAISVYHQQQIKKEINADNSSGCECD